MPYEDLQDPYGKRFWPKFRGRDGCRTPMVWLGDKMNGGFTEVKPWLPVAMEHLRMAVNVQEADPDSMLAFYRRMLAFRKSRPALAKGGFALHETSQSVVSYVREVGERRGLLRLQPRPGAGRARRCRPGPGGRSTAPASRRGSTGADAELPPYQALFAERG